MLCPSVLKANEVISKTKPFQVWAIFPHVTCQAEGILSQTLRQSPLTDSGTSSMRSSPFCVAFSFCFYGNLLTHLKSFCIHCYISL